MTGQSMANQIVITVGIKPRIDLGFSSLELHKLRIRCPGFSASKFLWVLEGRWSGTRAAVLLCLVADVAWGGRRLAALGQVPT